MPNKADIILAVQYSDKFLKVPELNGATVKLNPNGQPYRFTGGFTLVFQLTKGLTKWAFRVWHCGFKQQKGRFRKISQYLVNKELPYFADFIYDENGLFVSGEPVDTIRMKWLEGDLLKKYIEKNIDNPDELKFLAATFLEMFNSLHEHNISHGDLQHGNILIDEHGNILLIDYDSVCVPDIEGYEELVTGLKGYQHPSRLKDESKASLKADYFSELIIYLSLCAIAENPDLWDKYSVNDTEVLLFNENDFENIQQSNIYKELSNSKSNTIKSLLKILVEYLNEESYLNLKPFAKHKDFIESWDIKSKPVSKCSRCGKQINSSISDTICKKCQLEEINLKNLLQKREEADYIIAQAELKYNEKLTYSSGEVLIEACTKLHNARNGKDIAAIDAAISEVKDAIETAIPESLSDNSSDNLFKRVSTVFLILLAGFLIYLIASNYKVIYELFQASKVEQNEKQFEYESEYVQKLIGVNYVYWRMPSIKYHLYDDCQYLNTDRTADNFYGGTVADAYGINPNISSLCSVCEKRAVKEKGWTEEQLQQAKDKELNIVLSSEQSQTTIKQEEVANIQANSNNAQETPSSNSSHVQAQPNLQLLSLTANGTLYQNQIGSFTATLKNNGNAAYNSQLKILLQEPITTSLYEYIGNAVFSIAPGETKTITIKGIITLSPGTYDCKMVFDANNNPSNTNNHFVRTTLNIQVSVQMPSSVSSPIPKKESEERISATPSYSPMSWYQEGLKNSNAGNYSEAIRCYNKALDMNPNMSDAWYNLGIAYEKEKKKTEAMECYQKAAQLGNKHAQELLALRKGNNNATNVNEQKSDAPVYSAMSWYQDGVKNSNAGNYSEAIRCYRNALNLNPKLHNAWNGLANIYHLQGNYDKAIECFQESNNITSNGSAWYGMGLSYAKKNNHSISIECLKKSAQLGNKEAQKLLTEMNRSW